MKRIAIHSVPRSGSSWLGQIFNSSPQVIFKYQPLFSYAFKDFLDENAPPERIDDFFRRLALSDDAFLDQKDKVAAGSYPSFVKAGTASHIVYKEVRYHHILKNLLEQDKDIKIIGLVRDPLEVLNSWWLAPKEFRKDLGWDILEQWKQAPLKNLGRKEEFNGYYKWKEVAMLFESLRQQYPDRFYLLEYEKLVADTLNTVSDLFLFSGIPLQEHTISFLQKSTTAVGNEKDAYSVFRKRTGEDQKKKILLPQEIVGEILNDLKDSPLRKYLVASKE